MPDSKHFFYTRLNLITLRLVKKTSKCVLWSISALQTIQNDPDGGEYTENELLFMERTKQTMLQSN
jgi:hypothetical protein